MTHLNNRVGWGKDVQFTLGAVTEPKLLTGYMHGKAVAVTNKHTPLTRRNNQLTIITVINGHTVNRIQNVQRAVWQVLHLQLLPCDGVVTNKCLIVSFWDKICAIYRIRSLWRGHFSSFIFHLRLILCCMFHGWLLYFVLLCIFLPLLQFVYFTLLNSFLLFGYTLLALLIWFLLYTVGVTRTFHKSTQNRHFIIIIIIVCRTNIFQNFVITLFLTAIIKLVRKVCLHTQYIKSIRQMTVI